MPFLSAFRLSLFASFFVVFGLFSQAVSAANLYVDDDGEQCPAATYTSVQTAVDAAVLGDTVVICEGVYSEGPGTEGSNGLTITKSINIKGAGADLVTIQPTRATPSGGQIAAASPVLRDAVGNIVTVAGTPEAPVEVDISGVTISGGGDEVYFDPNVPNPIWNGEFENGVYAETGVLYLDAGGSIGNSRVTNVVTSSDPDESAVPGAYRSNELGWAVAKVTAATSAPGASPLPLAIEGSRFDRYNKGGVLIDGATGDSFPLTASGVAQTASIEGSSIVGRNLNFPANDGTGGGPLVTTGPQFGQDGVRVTSGSAADLFSNSITQNLPAGPGTDTDPALLSIASGVRFVDAAASSVLNSNLVRNGYGVVNVEADGTTANTAVPVDAGNNYWGVPDATGGVPDPVPNTGPGVSPDTMPGKPNNPVNGAVDVNFGSDAVHFQDIANDIHYRPGNEADSDGAWPIQDAPLPVADGAPTVSVTPSQALVAPGGTVDLEIDASDDFGVKSIAIYQGATLLDTITPPNDSYNWNAPAGCGAPQTVEFTVIAEDSSGQSEMAMTEVDVDDCAPEVQLSAEAASGQPLGTVKLNADASDDLALASLAFYEGGELITTVTNPVNDAVTSVNFTPDVPCGGSLSFEVVATDSTGHQASDTATFDQADCAPTVDLSAVPAEAAPGGMVNLTAAAEDDNEVAKLTFFAGETQLASFDTPDHAASWSKDYEWTAPNECGTSTVLKVIAEDDIGQTTEDTVTVTTTACPDSPPTVELAANPTSVDRGGKVTLTATATDDDAISNLTFFEGDTQIGSVAPPANSITWTAPDVCEGSYDLKVVAKDTADQTAEDSVTVTTNPCPPPGEPTVSLSGAPARIAQNGTDVKADATGEAGIKSVTFFLGTRKVCVDTAAPYSCKIVPKGSEIGDQSIRAVVTDELNRTAEDSASTRVSKFKPKNLVVKAKRIGRKKNRIMVSGRVVLPARMTAADGCVASRVTVKAKRGKRSLINQQIKLKGCNYRVAFGAPKTKRKKPKVVIAVRFAGNDSLTAIGRVRKVR